MKDYMGIIELELSDFNIGPGIMSYSEKGQLCTLKLVIEIARANLQMISILVYILVG